MFASPKPFLREIEIATIPGALRDVAGSSQLSAVSSGNSYDKREGRANIGKADDMP